LPLGWSRSGYGGSLPEVVVASTGCEDLTARRHGGVCKIEAVTFQDLAVVP
jgi:hypothetical protein